MNLVPVSAPTGLVTLAEAKDHLRIDQSVTDHDTELGVLIAAASGMIEGRDGYLGRAVSQQQWDMKLDPIWWFNNPAPLNSPWWAWYGWSYGWILNLPLPPLVSVDLLTYRDVNGTTQTYASTNYEVHGVGGYGRLTLKQGFYWPQLYLAPEAMTVRFTAGYTLADGTTFQVPPIIKAAALLLVGLLFDNRAALADPLPGAIKSMLAPFRVFETGDSGFPF